MYSFFISNSNKVSQPLDVKRVRPYSSTADLLVDSAISAHHESLVGGLINQGKIHWGNLGEALEQDESAASMSDDPLQTYSYGATETASAAIYYPGNPRDALQKYNHGQLREMGYELPAEVIPNTGLTKTEARVYSHSYQAKRQFNNTLEHAEPGAATLLTSLAGGLIGNLHDPFNFVVFGGAVYRTGHLALQGAKLFSRPGLRAIGASALRGAGENVVGAAASDTLAFPMANQWGADLGIQDLMVDMTLGGALGGLFGGLGGAIGVLRAGRVHQRAMGEAAKNILDEKPVDVGTTFSDIPPQAMPGRLEATRTTRIATQMDYDDFVARLDEGGKFGSNKYFVDEDSGARLARHELVNRISPEKFNALEVKSAVIRADSLPFDPEMPLRDAAMKYARENYLGKSFVVNSTGELINFNKDSLGKAFSFRSGRNQAKMASVSKLDEIIFNAEKVAEYKVVDKALASNPSSKSNRDTLVYMSVFELDGKSEGVFITVKRNRADNSLSFYHGHNIAKPKAKGPMQQSRTGFGNEPELPALNSEPFVNNIRQPQNIVNDNTVLDFTVGRPDPEPEKIVPKPDSEFAADRQKELAALEAQVNELLDRGLLTPEQIEELRRGLDELNTARREARGLVEMANCFLNNNGS